MPPINTKKKATAEPNPNRVRTRAGNANSHPGTAAKDALRVRNPPRDPDIIQKEKDEKALRKAEKKKMAEETQAREESAAEFVEEYRARKEAEAKSENAAIPRQKPRGQCLTYSLKKKTLCFTQLARTILTNLITTPKIPSRWRKGRV
jgi:hypothetical protein